MQTVSSPTVSVAPRAGAWIETIDTLAVSTMMSSHPVRVRGLKLFHRLMFNA